MRANLQLHRNLGTGYGRFGYEMEKSFARHGLESAGDIGFELNPDLDVESVALWLSTPPHVRGWYEGQLAAIFTMWESSWIPEEFRQNLHHFDRVFVPSEQNRELFARFHNDVRVVPLGVNPDVWGYQPRQDPDRYFTFLTAGYGARKGCAQVVEAFSKVFPFAKPIGGGPIPRLLARSNDDMVGHGVYTIPPVSQAEEVSIYAQAQCFVSGSKGEGWGLMPNQAIAQGCPTILGAAHGHAEFAHLGIGIGTHPFEADRATFWGHGGQWWEPNLDEMCEAMRYVYGNWEEARDRAAENSKFALSQFTWDNAAAQVITELPELFNEPPATMAWRDAPPRLYLIRVNREVTYTVNGVTHRFEPGRPYYEPGDLKRQILYAGQFDMDYFDPHDLGCDEDQVEQLRARNGRCPTCHQRFGLDTQMYELEDA